jgi:hypothetical protein
MPLIFTYLCTELDLFVFFYFLFSEWIDPLSLFQLLISSRC